MEEKTTTLKILELCSEYASENKNVQAMIPQKAEELMKLADYIIKKHVNDGPSSALKTSQIAEISFKNNLAKQKHQEGMKCLKLAIEAFNERDIILGTAKGQKDVSHTIKRYLNCVKDALLDLYKGSEENITSWGFTLITQTGKNNMVVEKQKSFMETLKY